MIVPDAFTEELESFIRKLYCPIMSIPLGQNLMVADEMFSDGHGAGVHFADIEDVGGPANLLNDLTASDIPGEDIFYMAVPNTPDKTVPATPNIFHTASQTPGPLQPPNDQVELVKREIKQRLDLLNVKISLLKIQMNEALDVNDREAAKKLMTSLDVSKEEKLNLERELEDVKEQDDDVDDEVKLEVKEEEGDNDDANDVIQEPICTQCGALFKSKIALVKHQADVHKKSLKVCDICGKTCDSQRVLRNHRRMHKQIECDICLKEFPSTNFKRHRSSCQPKLPEQPPEKYSCLCCDFSTDLESCLTKHIKRTHQKPVTLQCPHCSYSSKDKDNLNKYINYKHLAVKEKCDSCKKEFTTREILERHKRNAHQVKSGGGLVLFNNLEAPKVDSWYPCNSCDYKSKRKDNTERHKKTHLKTKPAHECSHCGKVFKKGASLKKHLERCRQFVPLKIGEEEAVELLSSGFNKKKVKTVLKFVRKISGRSKVETNLMKTVNTSIKNLEKVYI